MSEQSNFMTLYRLGLLRAEDIDDYIDEWHDAEHNLTQSLHDYLGMSYQEYAHWVTTNQLPE